MKNNDFLLILILSLISFYSRAGVITESSRIVYNASNKEQSFMIANNNNYPVLVQCWIDNGLPEGTPENAEEAPVIPLPGIFKLNPGDKKNIKLLSTQIKQPEDRESLYWFNVYEISPDDIGSKNGKNKFKVAVRLQLKFFYRPKSANGKFSLPVFYKKNGLLYIENKSPLYITLSRVILTGSKKSFIYRPKMLAPFEKLSIDSTKIGFFPDKVQYTIIDDDGNTISKSSVFHFFE